MLRHRVGLEMCNTLHVLGFYEIGDARSRGLNAGGRARTIWCPVRERPRQFYVLPQSPEIFKQILMIGGLEPHSRSAPAASATAIRVLIAGAGVDGARPGAVRPDAAQTIPGVIQQVMVRVCAWAGIEAKRRFAVRTYREAIRWDLHDKPDLCFAT